MPTVKEANTKSRAWAWMIRCKMEEKENEARLRLNEINEQQPELKRVYEEYLKLYDVHIKPLMPKVDQFIANIHEKRKIEHFLQGQAEHEEKARIDSQRAPNQTPGQRSWTLPPQVEKLPYASKSDIGKKPKKQPALNDDDANELMAKLKALDPKVFAQLLKEVDK